MKVKDAIVDKILAKTGKRPDSGPKRNNVVLQLYWKHNTAKIYINTSGTKASDRGYRKIPHSAPMRESLASAVIMASEYQGQSVFVNPMCGSGTLAIEAALTAAGRSPGLLRSNYGFMHLKPFNSNNYKDVRNSLLKQQRKRNTTIPQIIATDIDPDAIEAAQKNAQTAGVDHLINFKVCDFAETPIPEQGGIVILNPEYGQRLGEIRDLEQTYSRIGDFFKQQCQGYTGYIFTGNLELAKKVGLRTSKRIPFYNGTIECRLLRYELYKGTNKKKYNKSDL